MNKEDILNYVNDSDTEYGCFINGYWLSIAEILRILEKVVD